MSSIKQAVKINKKLTAKSINSIDISIIIKFFLLTTIPKIPIKNKIKAKVIIILEEDVAKLVKIKLEEGVA